MVSQLEFRLLVEKGLYLPSSFLFLFSGELQNLITNSSGKALKISGLIILFVLRVAVKSMCCQGDLAIVPAVQGWEKKAS